MFNTILLIMAWGFSIFGFSVSMHSRWRQNKILGALREKNKELEDKNYRLHTRNSDYVRTNDELSKELAECQRKITLYSEAGIIDSLEYKLRLAEFDAEQREKYMKEIVAERDIWKRIATERMEKIIALEKENAPKGEEA